MKRFKKRVKLTKRQSRKSFRKGAKTKRRNMVSGAPMRGGIRL